VRRITLITLVSSELIGVNVVPGPGYDKDAHFIFRVRLKSGALPTSAFPVEFKPGSWNNETAGELVLGDAVFSILSRTAGIGDILPTVVGNLDPLPEMGTVRSYHWYPAGPQ
jgi:hypothetical protein